jgi:hypothetical protein
MRADVSPNSIIEVKFERKSLPPQDAHNSSFQMPLVCFTNILRAAFYASLPKIQIQTKKLKVRNSFPQHFLSKRLLVKCR